MKELAILDGSGYVFRAYYGLPPLHDEDGHNVNAIFGFFRMLFRLWQQKPDHFVIAWDAPLKTARKEIDSTYKANRVSMPDEFKRQMGMIKELVGQLQIPAEEVPGFEADDIIATVARKWLPQGTANGSKGVKIVSSDKDLKQLVRDGVVMYDAMKNITTTQKSFQDEYGFAPEQMLDYLALMGDSSDNISGVRGIGKKGALQLVQQRGDMDNIYANIEKITGATKQKLIDGKEDAYHSRLLVTLMDVPGYEGLHDQQRKADFDFEHMHHVLVEGHQFDSLAKPLDELKKKRQGGEQLSLFG